MKFHERKEHRAAVVCLGVDELNGLKNPIRIGSLLGKYLVSESECLHDSIGLS